MRKTFKQFAAIATSLGVAVGYALVGRYLFAIDSFASMGGLMTLGFLFLVPVGLGALTVFLAPRGAGKPSVPYAILMPWVGAVLFAVTVSAILGLELLICVILALPVLLGMSSIGGIISLAVLRRRAESSGRTQLPALVIFLLAPYLVVPVESLFAARDVYRTVHTQIVVEADPNTVWANIVRVRQIRPDEESLGFSHWIGVPQPLEATMDGAGVGALREGRFEEGLLFEETITEWEPGQAVAFEIDADTSAMADSALREIGGPYFDVLDARYDIEPQADGTVILHLSSTHRLTTHFNVYAGLWADFILRDFQQYVLRVVKARAEADAG
jgi:hypothetical protein